MTTQQLASGRWRATAAAGRSMVAGLALVLAACGGSAPAGSGQPSAGASGPASAPASAITDATSGAGSGGASSGGTTAGVIDACGLLTDGDITATTGLAVTAKVPGPAFGTVENGCSWTLEQGDDIVAPTIELGVFMPGGRRYYDTYFKPFAAENGQEPVPGVGDEAISDSPESIIAVEGDAFVTILYLSDQRSLDVTSGLLKSVLAKVAS